jgi:putative transposase
LTDWRPDSDLSHLYFVTTTAVDRAHIFQRDEVKRILVDGLYHLHVVDGIDLYAFVVMPNHIHFIVRRREDDPL